MSSYDFAIVGAGISGAALAYYLKKGGARRVLLLERGAPASGGTGKSAAIVRQHYSTTLMARLAKRSVDLFRAMPSELGHDGGYRRVGYVFLSAPDNAAAAQKNVEMQRKVGIDTSWSDAGTTASRFAWLNGDGVAGSAFEPDGGYADPVQSVEAYVEAFKRLGGEVRTRTPCRKLVRQGDRITGIVTDDGTIDAGMVVNAAGPWAPALARLAGATLEMRSIREQDTVWEGRAGRDLPAHSISNSVDAIYIRPQGDRRYVVGRGFPKHYEDVDENNYKETPDDAFIADVQARLELRIPPMQGARLVHAYTALYDVTPDWYPFVGPRADLQGYADFNGGSGHGFKIAPGIAEELAGWLLTGKAAEDYRQLSYDRIAQKRLFVQSYGGNRG
ncbi:MAG: FAD-binding oxidoreductase [Alphaproteobacteria bacterium]|nr:FAD-binding oxidoreductase [Alphaproteobacteria bacterium]